MDRRYLVGLALAVVALVVATLALGPFSAPASDPLGPEQTYPAGAGADHINFTAIDADDQTVAQAPRAHWESYAIRYDAPPERRIVEGEYYINSSTGEVLGERWNNASVYIDGSTYAFVQPAVGLDSDRERSEFESDDAFVYDEATEAYYRYDPNYGAVAPTNIGRHTDLLTAYTWTATAVTTHHGVDVITYEVTGTRSETATPASNGTLQLGLNDGVVYSYDVTLDGEEGPYRYEYAVEPAPFPAHEWVDRARRLAGNETSAEG